MNGHNGEQRKFKIMKNYLEKVVSQGNINETIIKEELKKQFRELAEEIESES